ncbi:hypothetical protein [Algoriphagus sp. A40]|uniref:hypothetical protein n=1 Tax=Algoriphagus sp. A40 TaxID=1945863 RepID=UPI000984C1C2|nr:hypothetical protein [Algoriphagus sp. A40]OOG77433.1 hypothetical protein B0E43_04845 [Algoriphagus sp. A40]
MEIAMNLRDKSIALMDCLVGNTSDWLGNLDHPKRDIVVLDPIQLFSEIDWTCFEEDVQVINRIYSKLFDEVVITHKKLVCFWPLSGQLGNDWFELASLCKANHWELEIYKSVQYSDEKYGFSDEIIQTWKKFVYFLIESLIEDIQLNEEFEEIGTLTSDQDSIVLFKLEQGGKVIYSFAFESLPFELFPSQSAELTNIQNLHPSFDTFNEMLDKLLDENDLSLYQTKFSDPQLEKAYFNVLAREFKTKNLITGWINTYSLN